MSGFVRFGTTEIPPKDRRHSLIQGTAQRHKTKEKREKDRRYRHRAYGRGLGDSLRQTRLLRRRRDHDARGRCLGAARTSLNFFSRAETLLAALHRPSFNISAITKALMLAFVVVTTDARLKKRIVRAVIKEVVADVDAEAGEIILLLHWMGRMRTSIAT